MKYALLIYDTADSYEGLSEEEIGAIRGEYFAISEDDRVYGGAQLQPIQTATTVKVNGGGAMVTDGPFADTKEFFGGFYLLEAEDLDAALAVAARVPAARLGGSVEVRPIVEQPS